MAPSGWNTPGLAVNENGDYEDRNGTIVDSKTKENTRTTIKPTTTDPYQELFTAAFGGDDLSDDIRNYMSTMYATTRPTVSSNNSGSTSYTSSVVGKLMEDHKVITELAKEQGEAIQEVVSDMEIFQKIEENQNLIDDRLNEMEFKIKEVVENFENSMLDIDARLEYLESKENV